MECLNRSPRKVGEQVLLRVFETQLGKALYDMVCIHSSPFSAMWVRPETSWGPFPPLWLCAGSMNSPFLKATSLGGDFSSNWKGNPFASLVSRYCGGVVWGKHSLHMSKLYVYPSTDIHVDTGQWPETAFKLGGSPRPKRPSFI